MAGPFIWNGTNSKALTATASAANFVYGFNTTATSAGTLTLTGISAGIQQLTGTSTHDVVLPATNLVALGFQFQIINRSTQTVTVKGSTGSIVQSMATQTVLTVTASVSGAPGTWDVNYNDTAFAIPLAVAKGGTGTTTGSITGTGALTFAAGGTNQNVTLTPSGTGYTLLNGNVGIGTTSPQATFQVGPSLASNIYTPFMGSMKGTYTGTISQSGVAFDSIFNPGSTVNTLQVGLAGAAILTGASSANNGYMVGVYGRVSNISPGTLNFAQTFRASNCLNSGGGSIANCYGFYSEDQTNGGNNYGFFSNVTTGANKYDFYAAGGANNYFAGNVGIGTNAPGSTSHVAGSFQVKLSALSANTTLDGTYHAMTVDASGAARTITLPAASATIIGRVYRIKKIDSSANAVTIARTGADTIDGAPNFLLTSQYQSVDVICSSATTWSIF